MYQELRWNNFEIHNTDWKKNDIYFCLDYTDEIEAYANKHDCEEILKEKILRQQRL